MIKALNARKMGRKSLNQYHNLTVKDVEIDLPTASAFAYGVKRGWFVGNHPIPAMDYLKVIQEPFSLTQEGKEICKQHILLFWLGMLVPFIPTLVKAIKG